VRGAVRAACREAKQERDGRRRHACAHAVHRARGLLGRLPVTNLSSQFELKVGLDMSRYGWPIGAVDKRWPFNFFSLPGCFETAVTPGAQTEFV
jgi:hypothetical protein